MAEDYDVNELGFTLGSISRWSPYDGLTDDEADELQAELEARAARRLPFGFRATRARKGALPAWPNVPRFDTLEEP